MVSKLQVEPYMIYPRQPSTNLSLALCPHLTTKKLTVDCHFQGIANPSTFHNKQVFDVCVAFKKRFIRPSDCISLELGSMVSHRYKGMP